MNTLFEFPLNERIRAFIRIEAMLAEINHNTSATNSWDVKSGIYALNRLLHFLERKDYRIDIIQELERQLSSLKRLINNPSVNKESLESAILAANRHVAKFRHMEKCYDDSIKDDELLKNIRLRIATANLISSVDLPCLHAWLHSSDSEQQERLLSWASHFKELDNVIYFILSTIRDASLFEYKETSDGTYQQSLDQQTQYSLVRLHLASSNLIFPEISGGKHRINVRFLKMFNKNERPKQVENPVNFEISFC